MSNSNGVISAPVSIDDVKTVLGESSNDLATLCKSSNINMWAKYKPVDYSADFMDIKSCYKGKAENFNINYPVCTNIKDVIPYYSQTNNGWSYQTVSSPYRLGDFVGYNHIAAGPVNKLSSGLATTDETSVNLSYNVSSTSSDNLGLDDFLALGDSYYLGCILSKNGTDVTYFRTSKTLSGITADIVDFKSIKAGTYTVYPFMSSVDYYTTTQVQPVETVGTYIPLPTVKPITITVKKSGGEVTMTVSTSLGRVSVENNDSESHVVSVLLRFTTSKDGAAMQFGESYLITNETLASEGSIMKKYTTKMEEGEDYKLMLYVDNKLTDTVTVGSTS